MKIQAKITFLLLLLLALFTATIFIQKDLEQQRSTALFQDQKTEREGILDTILNLKSTPLASFVYDYTYWDEMVNFVKRGNKEWARENIEASMATFGANAVWTYNLSGKLMHSFNNLNDAAFTEIPVDKDAFGKIFKKKRVYKFYVQTKRGLMEIHGATVHPTSDAQRKTPPQGYFFAGHVWDADYISEIGRLSGSNIKIVPLEAARQGGSQDTIYLSRVLYAWDASPLARMDVSIKSAILQGFNKTARKLSFLFFIFTIATMIILFLVLMRWISGPLKVISMTLDKRDPAYLSTLQKDKAEFGNIARLICRFFEQQEELVKEIAERKKTAEELKSAYGKLQATHSQLVQSAKMASVGLLAGGVAHEINNPLTGVLNNVQLIKMISEQKKDFSLDDFKDLLGLIEESAERCSRIVRSLLDFSRASKGVFQSLSLNEMVEKVIVLIEHELNLQNIVIETKLASDLPPIKGDPQLIQQIIFDIINNAKWAIQKRQDKRGGAITIGTRQELADNTVSIFISDNGIGIPKENMEHIFEPFFTTKPIGEGTGLGLSIAYNIINEHNGKITVESLPGKGTTFIIKLPVIKVRHISE